MKYGFPAATIEKMHAVLARFPRVEKAVLYGSRAKGNYKPGSDIDLTLFGEDLNSSQLGEIATALDDLLLPYTIDLSLYADLNHTKLREHIDRVGVVFYERGGGCERSWTAGLKKGWEIKRLGEVCEVIAGQSPEGKFYNAEGKGMPFYQGKKDFGDKFIEAPTTWTTQTTKIAKEGDILISVRAPVGPVNFATDEVCIGRGLAAIRSGDELNRDFLFYQLWHLQPEIAGREGAVFASINKAEIEALPLAFAPLAEQQRIVGLLDEAFAGLATAKANAEKNLQNARALFESHLQSVFTQRGPGWVEKRLDELCTFSSGGTPSKGNSSFWQGEIPWVSGRDMKSSRLSDSALHISQAAVDESATRMASAGTLLILVRGMGLAHGAQIAELLVPCAFNQDIRGVHAKPAMLPRYLLFALRDGINSSDTVLSNAAHGTLKIDSNELQKVIIPFPPLEQQRKIVAVIDALSEETQRLARLYERKLAALEELKKALLHQAFAGGL